MTTPSILPEDFLIRKFRIDDLIAEPSNRQYIFKEGDERKWPANSSFSFPNEWAEDGDNSISLYVENFLERANISNELLLETITRPREDKQDVQYSAFRVPVQILNEYSDLLKVVYDFDSKDPIPQRGLCHVLISFREVSDKSFKARKKAWAKTRNKILENLYNSDEDNIIETDSFRLS